MQRNPLELLRKVNAVKDEYKALVQEMAEIHKAQAVSMNTTGLGSPYRCSRYFRMVYMSFDDRQPCQCQDLGQRLYV